MEHQANYDSIGVVIEQLCRDWREIRGAAISDIPKYVQDTVLHRSGFSIHLQREPNSGRCFPSLERPWIGGDGTLNIMCYADGDEGGLINNPQHFFEQLGVGVVLAHLPNFTDAHLTRSVTLQSFRKDYPQLADLGDMVCTALKAMINSG